MPNFPDLFAYNPNADNTITDNGGSGYYDYLASQPQNSGFHNSDFNSEANNEAGSDPANPFNPPKSNDGSSKGNSQGLAAGNLVGGAIGAYEYFKAQTALKKLNATPQPNYSVSNELQTAYSGAISRANQGFSPGEKAAYQSNLSRSNATTYNRAVGLAGGNLSNVVSAGIDSQNVQGLNQLSIGDAQLRRQNQQEADRVASEVQAQKNKATEQNILLRQQQEEVYGNAAKSGLQSFANSFNLGGIASTLGTTALTAALA